MPKTAASLTQCNRRWKSCAWETACQHQRPHQYRPELNVGAAERVSAPYAEGVELSGVRQPLLFDAGDQRPERAGMTPGHQLLQAVAWALG